MTDKQERDAKVEELAQACLEQLALGIEPSVEQICREHPQLVDRVRRVLLRLRAAGLVEPTPTSSGETFGEFRLLRKLGEGGMGVVWLAEQPRLHRTVALKLLRPGLHLHPRLRERFRREVQALSKLDHPNICTVYEAGEVDGSPFLAMRHIEGESLQQALDLRRRERNARLSTGTSSRELFDLLHLVERVALALHAAHAAGVVHRDVKPGNILIDTHGEPVIVDFGLAHDDDPALSVLTLTGEPVGTPTYMAPEQVAGNGPIDRRADVYALGVILYECATLRPPFAAPSREGLYRSILHDPVPDPRQQNRAVSRDLRAVLEKALAKDPRQRFATALEFAEELSRIRRHEPVRTRSIGPVLRTVRWCRRNRAATAVLAVVTTALLVSVWALRRSIAAEAGLRALALVAAAEQVAPENPELAFKLGREALRQDPAHADPLVVASLQQTMFRLRSYDLIREASEQLDWLQVSPDADGRFVVVTGRHVNPTLHRGDDGSLVFTFPFPGALQRPAIAFSPDGEMLAVGDDHGMLHLYRLGRGEPTLTCEFGARKDTALCRVAWSPRGTCLVLAHGDGVASVWTPQGRHLHDLLPTEERVGGDGPRWRVAAFLPDGRVVAAGAIWSDSFEPEVPLRVGGSVPQGVADICCTETRVLAYGGRNRGAVLWDHAGNVRYRSPEGRPALDQVLHGAFDPSGTRFGLCTGRGLEILSAEDGRLLDRHRVVRSWIWHVSWSRDGSQLAVADSTGTVRVWRQDELAPIELVGHLGAVAWTAFSPAGDRLFSTGWDGQVRLWRPALAVGTATQIRAEGKPGLRRAGDRVILTSGLGEVVACDLDGRELRRAKVGPDWCSLGADPGGRRVAIAATNGEIRTWDPDRPEEPKLEYSGEGFFAACGILADGRIAVRCGARNRGLVLDHGRLVPIPPFDAQVATLVVSADGTAVLSGDATGRWWLSRLRDGTLEVVREQAAFVGQSVFALALSSDGSRVLAGSSSGEVAMWDLASGNELYRSTDHRGSVLALGFSPSGQRIATGSFDGTVRVIDLVRPDRPVVLGTWDRGDVWELLWIDERRLVTAAGDGVRWWCVDGDSLKRIVEGILVDDLTADEEDRYRSLLGR